MHKDRAITLAEVNSDAFVARLRAGDGQAFADLLACLVPRLCGYLSHDFQLGEQDAEDVALEAMVKVHKSVAQFNLRGGAKLSTWVFRITKNTAIDFKRCQTRQAAKVGDVPLDGVVSRQVDHKKAAEWFRRAAAGDESAGHTTLPQVLRVTRALKALSEKDRDILIMRQSMEYEEIAEVEKVGVEALRTRYSRALDRLRNELQKDEGQ
jgi:RNA polymerase sigma factor (sigma-70 family)